MIERKGIHIDNRYQWPTVTGQPHLDKIDTGIIKVQKYLNVNDQMMIVVEVPFDFYDTVAFLGASI